MYRAVFWIAGALLLTSQVAVAEVSDEAFARLKSDFEKLAQRFEQLAAENAELRAASDQTRQAVADVRESKDSASWAERIRLKGDFRYRYENIDEELKDERNRQRLRARAQVVADLPNDVQVGMGIASGSEDPVSTNQTLGSGGSSKSLNLDLAYFDWSGIEGLHVVGGKFKNPLFRPAKSGLLWDGDWNPEGFSIQYAGGPVFAILMGTWLESDSKTDNTEFAWGGQAGATANVAGAMLTAGAGYYEIDTAGKSTFFGDSDDFFGNSFDPVTETYLFDYELLELFAEAALEVADMPLTLFADYVNNGDAGSFDTGWVAGAKLGSAKEAGSWQAQYAYQDLEADAVFGLLTDSDFGGGGTDGKGHILKGAYAINKQLTVGLTYFINEINENLGTEADFDRLQIDAKFKYK